MVFTVLCFVAALVASTSATCSHSLSCPCGTSNKNYTFCVDGLSLQEQNPCSRWSHCGTCQEGVSDCITCPSGRSGELCTTEKDSGIYCVHQAHISNGTMVVHRPEANRAPGSTVNYFKYTSHPVGTQLRYSCQNGFALEGSDTLVCESSGFWSTDPPACVEIKLGNENSTA